jgi:hypothetical protein
MLKKVNSEIQRITIPDILVQQLASRTPAPLGNPAVPSSRHIHTNIVQDVSRRVAHPLPQSFFLFPYQNVGAPSLRFLQGWAAMLLIA